MSGLSDEQRERLAPFDHGEYLCPCQRGACNDRCRKQHEDLYDVVAAIADEAAAEAVGDAHPQSAVLFMRAQQADARYAALVGKVRALANEWEQQAQNACNPMHEGCPDCIGADYADALRALLDGDA